MPKTFKKIIESKPIPETSIKALRAKWIAALKSGHYIRGKND